jgi:hypothetical protein
VPELLLQCHPLVRLRRWREPRPGIGSASAGTAYQSGLAALSWYSGGEYVVTDGMGTPVHPEWYSDEFGRLLRRPITLRNRERTSPHTATQGLALTWEQTLTCGYVARSEGLEPPTF